MEDEQIVEEMQRVLALLEVGVEGLMTFQKSGGGILRDTAASVFGVTSLHRTFAAMAQALRVLTEEDRNPNLVRQLREALNRTWENVYLSNANIGPLDVSSNLSGEALRKSAINNCNNFTDAHLLCALAYHQTAWLDPIKPCESATQRICELKSSLASDLSKALCDYSIGRLSAGDRGHDFVTLWMVRGVDAASPSFTSDWPPRLVRRIRDDILRQLGWESAGVSSRFDPSEVAFGMALLQRLAPDELRPLVPRCLEVLATSQTSDGAWPTSRLISPGDGAVLHVTSYEVALTLATWLDMRGDHRPLREPGLQVSVDKTIEMLRRSFLLAEASLTNEEWEREEEDFSAKPQKRNRRFGWSNDRTRGQGKVESWVTAVVVTFLVSYYDLLRAQLQRRILDRYDVTVLDSCPNNSLDESQTGAVGASDTQAAPSTYSRYGRVWPDFCRSYVGKHYDGEPERSATVFLEQCVSDPTPRGRLAQNLAEVFVRPVTSSPVRRPGKSRVSLVMTGPPGSRKTSLMEGLAIALGWPLVTVSPPTFLYEGLDGLERTAAQVFTDLTRLRRVVILFDECEELFRDRGQLADKDHSVPSDKSWGNSSVDRPSTQPTPATRTAGAFITTGMLPRLQALHDKQWCIFALATNVALDELDRAATRPGRFDYVLHLQYPKLEAQVRYMDREIPFDDVTVRDALRARAYKIGIDKSALPWAVLKELIVWRQENKSAGHSEVVAQVDRLDTNEPPAFPDSAD